ncbi:secretin N-terminal domain-containing protein [Chitinasiproducens palmae]|uniref:Type IVB pilus formation outer membrane protein, R64 PilN family n=1 Tax=Chitinasiproducens palmae TaxID=1770053 RepID=A0A1H2PJI0_9BURK|nr:secretin N-terminal domain-containing protein [Chitinasiproducens palmae]SDV46547.1 type IVB pilus formation outer membrane protein, R64 PilN family [Chitinasiproducens palmae]
MKPRVVATAAILAALGACSTLRDEVRSSQNDALDTTNASFDEAAEPAPVASAAPFAIEPRSYVALQASRVPAYRRLPDTLERRSGVTLAAAAPLDLPGIASLLTRVTGIPVAIDESAGTSRDGAATTARGNDQYDAARIGEALSNVAPRAVTSGRTPSAFAAPAPLSDRQRMDVRFQGPLSQFLRLIESYFNVGWRYENGTLHLARSITRTFPIAALPSLVTAQADLNIGLTSEVGDNSGGGNGSNSNSGSKSGVQQSASVQVAFDLWKDIDATVKTILGGQGAYTLSRGLSALTVTAAPRLMDDVSKYVESVNRQLERQVTVNVAVYSVTLDDASERRFSLHGLFASGRFLAGVNDPGNALSGDTISAGVLDGRNGNISGLLKLLDQTGRVSVVTNASVTTMSGQPVPLQVSNARGYVSKIGTVMNQITTQREVTTSTVTTGFALNVLPKVLDSGEVLLQYGVNISALVGKDGGFDRIRLGDKEPELSLPNVDQRSFVQESLLHNGSTLVMAGFQHVNETMQEDGKGSTSFKAFGGGSSASRKRQLIVICITPKVHRREARFARAGG